MAMATTGRPFLADAPAVVKPLRLYLRLVLLLDLLFVAVYGGLNWLTARRQDLWDLHFDWETRIPFVPGMIYAYLSINVLFVLPLFVMDARGMRLLARRIAWAIVLSGVVFLLLPARLGFTRPAEVPGYEAVYALLYALDAPHNLVPSLHVAYSALIIASLCTPRAARWVQALLWGWLGLVAVAVVLVHQHHLADVAGGVLVAWICWIATKEDAP
jgi:membrane-associated phospholipid phosphatase